MSKHVILEFAKYINNHDVDGISKLLSEEHTFIDAYGHCIKGKEEMKKSWAVYFEWFPDYVIDISEIICGSDSAALLGHASGTYRNQKDETNSFYWKLPSAWRVVVENEKIKIWQVYCDTKIPSQIMEKVFHAPVQPIPPPPMETNKNAAPKPEPQKPQQNNFYR